MGTLEQVAAIGYREVEYGGGGYDKMDHAALRKTMERLGLTSPSIHVGYEALASDFDGAVAMTKALGADTLLVPYLGEAHRSADGWKAAVADFNRYADRLTKAALGFAYHHPAFDFTHRPGGPHPFDPPTPPPHPRLLQHPTHQ